MSEAFLSLSDYETSLTMLLYQSNFDLSSSVPLGLFENKHWLHNPVLSFIFVFRLKIVNQQYFQKNKSVDLFRRALHSKILVK